MVRAIVIDIGRDLRFAVLRQALASPVTALFAVGAEDTITPEADVRKLYQEAAAGSELVVVPEATHEAVTYYFKGLVPPVLAWLKAQNWE